jgi:hypothetical protein
MVRLRSDCTTTILKFESQADSNSPFPFSLRPHRFLCCIFCGLHVLYVCDFFVYPLPKKTFRCINAGSLSGNVAYTDSSCRFSRRERRLFYGSRMSSGAEAVRTVCPAPTRGDDGICLFNHPQVVSLPQTRDLCWLCEIEKIERPQNNVF